MTEEIHSAYQRLELPDGANLPQVQKAWRELMKVWHPDLVAHNPDLQRQAEERTKQINNAYDILKRYLKDGDIPRPRPSKQSQKQESQKQTRQTRSRPRSSKQSKKQESQKQTRQTRSRPRSSKQSKKQESQKRTRQQETASEDAHSSQTHEEENRQKQTTKPKKEKDLAAKIGGIIRIIFVIIFGAIIGHFTGRVIVSLLDWMIEEVSGWSFIDRANLWSETFSSKTLIIVPLIATFLKAAEKSIGSDGDAWFGYTFVGVCGGTIGGIIGGVIGNEMGSARIATYIGIGAFFGTCLACSIFSEDES